MSISINMVMVTSLTCLCKVLDRSCVSDLLHQLTEPSRNFVLSLEKKNGSWHRLSFSFSLKHHIQKNTMQLEILRRKALRLIHTQKNVCTLTCLYCLQLDVVPSEMKISISIHASEQSRNRFLYHFLDVLHLLTSYLTTPRAYYLELL